MYKFAKVQKTDTEPLHETATGMLHARSDESSDRLSSWPLSWPLGQIDHDAPGEPDALQRGGGLSDGWRACGVLNVGT